MRTRIRQLALLAPMTVGLLFGSAATAAATTQQKAARPLAVSVPAEPTAVAPGATGKVALRVVNPGNAAVTVTVSGAGLQFGNDGRVTVGSTPDSRWQGLVDYPRDPLTVPAQGYADTALTVRMPAQINPDLYFIGFLVTPQATGQGNIRVVNQIGSFVTVDVPGPRVRELAGTLRLKATLGGSHFVLGSQTNGTVSVLNVGRAEARFWGESDTSSSFGGAPHQQRIDKLLLPVGRSRSFTVTGKPVWPVGFVTIKVHILYPDVTEVATKELVLSKRVLVVNPLVLAALFAAICVAIAWWIRRRQRRRPTPGHTVTRNSSPRPPAHGPRHSQRRRPSERPRVGAH